MVGNGMYARAATDIGPQTNSSLALSNSKSNYFPISFRFIGGRNGSTQFTLFTTSLAIRKPWIEKIRRQQEEKDKRRLIFEMAQIIGEYSFYDAIRINHFITFSKFNEKKKKPPALLFTFKWMNVYLLSFFLSEKMEVISTSLQRMMESTLVITTIKSTRKKNLTKCYQLAMSRKCRLLNLHRHYLYLLKEFYGNIPSM
jgi:hypothetical protein